MTYSDEVLRKLCKRAHMAAADAREQAKENQAYAVIGKLNAVNAILRQVREDLDQYDQDVRKGRRRAYLARSGRIEHLHERH